MRNSFSHFNPSACSKILEPSKNSREGWWRSGGGKGGGGGEIQRCCFPRWGYELACRCEDKFWSSSLSPCNKHRITSSFYSLSHTHTTIFVQQTWSSYLRWLCWLFVSWLCPLVVFTVRKRSMTAGRPMSQDVFTVRKCLTTVGGPKTIRDESVHLKRLVNHAVQMTTAVHISVTIQANASRLGDQTQWKDRWSWLWCTVPLSVTI